MYKRKTTDEFTLQGFCSGQWEDLTTEETRHEIKKRQQEYRENEGGSYRIIKRRVKL